MCTAGITKTHAIIKSLVVIKTFLKLCTCSFSLTIKGKHPAIYTQFLVIFTNHYFIIAIDQRVLKTTNIFLAGGLPHRTPVEK